MVNLFPIRPKNIRIFYEIKFSQADVGIAQNWVGFKSAYKNIHSWWDSAKFLSLILQFQKIFYYFFSPIFRRKKWSSVSSVDSPSALDNG